LIRDVAAMIQIHAIARYIQRTGEREPDALLPVLKRAACWSMISLAFDLPGSWMLPVENGLICATGGRWKQSAEEEGRRVPFIRTFIAKENFRPRSAEVWNRLVDAGALERTPLLLAQNKDPELFRLWGLMAQEGRAWDERRAYAKRLQEGRGPVPVPSGGDPEGEELDDDPEPV
jgi:hypothetical protein